MLADTLLIVQIAMPMLGLFGAAYVFFSAQQVCASHLHMSCTLSVRTTCSLTPASLHQNFKILGGTKLHDMPSWAPEYREALQRRFLSNVSL